MNTNTTVSPFAEFLGHAIYQFTIVKPLLPTYGHLLVSALFPIYIGSHASLSRPSSAAKPPKRRKDGHESGSEEEDEGERGTLQKMESLEPSDALMFPLIAGLTLGGLYLVIKWLEDPAILNKILSFYFSQMGIVFAIAFLKDGLLILRSFIFPARYRYAGKIWRVKQSEHVFMTARKDNPDLEVVQVRKSPLPGVLGSIPLPNWILEALWSYRGLAYQKATLRAHVRGIIDIKSRFDLLDVVSGGVALAVVAYFAFVKKPWWLTNFLGFSFCYGALQFMTPSTFWTGSLILGSLFFYDIYFVFFTPLMVTVATKLDVPIKLLFPRPPSPDAPDVVSLAMLGLGDIVIPGMMVGLALRFDLYMYYRQKGILKAQVEGNEKGFVKPQYQSATGGWGERFWVRKMPSPHGPELEPPYHDAKSFPKTYFHASLVGYVIGMIATLIGMQYSNRAQPALLYLVPGVLISLWGTALFKGDIREMWNFSDSQEDEEYTKEKKREEKKSTEKKAKAPARSLFVRILSGDIKALKPETLGKDGQVAEPRAKEGAKDEASLSPPATKDASDVDEATSREAERPSDRASREPRGKHDGDDDTSSELIFFSIRLHRNKKTPQLKSSSEISPSSPSENDEPYALPVSPGRDGESPAKRRRLSPRKKAS